MTILLKFTSFIATHLCKQHKVSTLLRFHDNVFKIYVVYSETQVNNIKWAHCCVSMTMLLKFTSFRATHLRKQHRASTLLRFHGNSDYASTPMLPYKYTAYITTFKCTEFSTFPNSLHRSTFMFDILKNTWFSNLRRHTGYLNSVSC
jgi:hypothetical protein